MDINAKNRPPVERLRWLWSSMIRRCENSSAQSFKYYGARGIRVCDEWRHCFEAFRLWSLANSYRDYLSIDRIDNDKNYEPSNCRWVTMKEQQNNRRNNTLHIAFGESKTAPQWADDFRCVVSYGILRDRIFRGWKIVEAMTTPKLTGQRIGKRKQSPESRAKLSAWRTEYYRKLRAERQGSKQ